MVSASKKNMVRTRKRIWRYRPVSQITTYSTTTEEPKVIIKRYVNSSMQTDDELPQAQRKQFGIQDLESVNRITNIPVVESAWDYAENVYNRIKKSNTLIFWTLHQAESSVNAVYEATTPAILFLQGPIASIDKLVCKSLDIVEQTVPQINLPPQMIYSNTKQYVTEVGTKIARPVLKRADSVKQMGNTVLASKYTTYAAETLDEALNVADKYMDRYLPAEGDQGNDIDEVDKPIDGPTGKAIHTMQHAKGFSRKLKRRLTQRTIAEVKALKQQSAEAVHILIYVAELIATDPILAFQKGRELWINLSKDEPENQARPENLEQLIILLTRESARRIVHLINFSGGLVSQVPKKVSHSLSTLLGRVLVLTDSMVKTVHLETVQRAVMDVLKIQGRNLAVILKEVNNRINEYLEQVAENLAEEDPPKSALSVPQIKVQPSKATHRTTTSKSNGIENNS